MDHGRTLYSVEFEQPSVAAPVPGSHAIADSLTGLAFAPAEATGIPEGPTAIAAIPSSLRAAVNPRGRMMAHLNILYVCDFASVHSRTYVSYFANRPAEYRVTVVSTTGAPPMENVTLIELTPRTPGSDAARKGRLGRLAYTAAGLAPQALAQVRRAEAVWKLRRSIPQVRNLSLPLKPDIVHALRTHPEGVLAWELRQSIGEVPLFLSTWGQDLVTWAAGSPRLAEWTSLVMADVDALLPDTDRDGRLAKTRYGLSSDALVMVMPATGGLDLALLNRAEAGFGSLVLRGSPLLLSVRGYPNIYNNTKVLFEAFAEFRTVYPNAHLVVDGRQGHAGADTHRRWMAKYGVSASATQVHLSRHEVFEHMSQCEMYVSSTLSDGLPMSLLEAMYFGEVPITTRHESVRPPIEEGRNGFTVDSQTAGPIASTWARAVELVPHRETIRARNRAAITRDYDRAANLAKVAIAYSDQAASR